MLIVDMRDLDAEIYLHRSLSTWSRDNILHITGRTQRTNGIYWRIKAQGSPTTKFRPDTFADRDDSAALLVYSNIVWSYGIMEFYSRCASMRNTIHHNVH